MYNVGIYINMHSFHVFAVIGMNQIRIRSSGNSRTIKFQPRNPSTWHLMDPRTDLFITNTSSAYTSIDNVVAYYPQYNDHHGSDMAILFINLEAVYPCVRSSIYHPPCTLFSAEEDGFRGGRSIIQASDIGNDLEIFSESSSFGTFGFGLVGCSTFDTSCVDDIDVELICLLPRIQCYNQIL